MIKELSKLIENNSYDNYNYHKITSSLKILENSDLVFKAYFKEEVDNKGELVLKIYGLLQNLFVYIDALYDLVKGVLNNKHLININQNINLRKIKHIRNDIVGHPTFRTYSRGGVSFSVINFNKTSLKEIYYETFYYYNKKEEVFKEIVKVKDLVNNYLDESELIFKEMIIRLTNKKVSKLYLDSYHLVKNINNSDNMTLLTNLKEKYIKEYDISFNSHNRFIWRLNLLKKLLLCNNEYLNEIMDYLKYYQANKLYLMFLELENQKYHHINYKIPNLISSLIKEIKERKLVKYVYNLNDKTHFYFKQDVKELFLLTKNPLFEFLLKEEDSDLIYAVGSVIRNLSLLK